MKSKTRTEKNVETKNNIIRDLDDEERLKPLLFHYLFRSVWITIRVSFHWN